MTRFVAFAALSGALTLAACDGLGQAMTSHTDVLARAAGHELTVEQAANLLAPATRIPAQTEVVDAIANLWVDYTLLATAAAKDSTLGHIDLDGVVEPYFNQQLVFKLRDAVITVDTALTDEQLRQQFERDQPNAEVHARHILFRMPADALQPVKDSVKQRAQQVLQQARAGVDFAKLATEHSEESGAGERGGDLGYFGRGQMLQPFEEAAFALEKGQISDLVETPFGIHIIKVEDKRLPDFETAKVEYRQQVVQQRYAAAEEQYLTNLTSARELEVEDDAIEVARELARKPSAQLGRRAARRSLVRYTNGALTAGEYVKLMQQRPAQQRGQVAAASDEQLREWLRLLARDEILIGEAKARGLETPASAMDSARTEIRLQLRQAAREAGLMPITPQASETQNQALQRQVLAFLNRIVNGEADVVPLGAIGFTVREQYGGNIVERAVPVVVARVEERRPAPAPADTQQPPPQTPPPTTTGGN
jgi:PPIC-type PPIASE domain